MRSFLTLFAISLILTLFLTPQVRRLAKALGAVDLPDNHRRIHQHLTPRMGGVAIYLAFGASLLCVPLFGTLISHNFLEQLAWYRALMLPASLVFLLGVYDDLRGVNAKAKLIVQVVAALILYAFGFAITQVSLPFGGAWMLPLWLSLPATVLWLVGITNAFNLVDGIDGLAAGASAFALISVLFFSMAAGQWAVALVAVALTGAVLGFLSFNFYPATIFLGDSGSLFLGFMVAALSLAGSQKGTTTIAIAIPLISFGLPVLDVGLAITRRLLRGQPILQSDRGHIHHRLLEQGFSQRQTAILLYGVCALFTLFGILLLNPTRSMSALIFCVVGGLVVLGVQRLRYPEFEALGSALRQRVTARWPGNKNKVSAQSLIGGVKRVASADCFFASLPGIVAEGAFEGITLAVKLPLSSQQKFALLRCGEVNGWRLPMGRVPGEEVGLTLMYGRNDRFVEDMTLNDGYCALMLPLSFGGRVLGVVSFFRSVNEEAVSVDLKNICELFQQELSPKLAQLIETGKTDQSSLAYHVQK